LHLEVALLVCSHGSAWTGLENLAAEEFGSLPKLRLLNSSRISAGMKSVTLAASC